MLIDTAGVDLFIALIEHQQVLATVHQPNLIRKSEVLASEVAALLSRAGITINDIKRFYVTKGPGSFMGARLALLFASVVCLITKAELFTANSFALLPRIANGQYFLKFNSNTCYVQHDSQRLGVAPCFNGMMVDYSLLVVNIAQHLKLFVKSNNILNEQVLYLKTPNTGGK